MQVYGQASAPPRGPSLTGFFQILQLAHAGISLTLFRTHTAVMHRTSRHTTHAQPSQAPPSFTCGPPGPKSGKHSGSQPPAPCYLLRLGVHLLCITRGAGVLDARVVTPALGVTGVGNPCYNPSSASATKLSLGKQATHESRPQGSVKVQKRTYARALRRVDRYGAAWHKGRWIGPDARFCPLRESATKVPATSTSLRKPPPTPSHNRHYNLFSWNTGGLGGGLYDEFLLYLKQSRHDIVLLQETTNPCGKTVRITLSTQVRQPKTSPYCYRQAHC